MLLPRLTLMLTALFALGGAACVGGDEIPDATTSPSPPTQRALEIVVTRAPLAVSDVSGQLSGPPNVPTRLQVGWGNTDFTKHSVPFFEIISGGVRRDRILPIDHPTFLSVSEVHEYMRDDDPVIALEVGGDAKAYPLDILQWHEIVNDELGGVPVTISY